MALHCSYKVICIIIIVGMPSEETMLLKFTQYQKSSEGISIVYAGIESFIKKSNWM